MRKSNRFNSEAIMKVLSDHTGHFVVGILGKQGVGHKTEGIDMYVTSERVILLDTEPIQSWTVLERALRDGLLNTNNSLPPDLWLEMETLYQIIFMISVCNVLIIATDGPNIDMDILRLLHSAEMLKFHIPDFPLLINQQDLNYFPDIVFVCNKSSADDFTWEKCRELHILLRRYFDKTSMRIQGLVSLGNSVPYFEMDDIEEVNLFFLPDQKDEVIDKFDSVIQSLRDQVFAAPRRPGKKGQVSEKDWYRNTVKIFEIVRKSEYIQEYINVLCKIRDS
ncbi:hypothetical protein BDF20DRAFT_906652 [Mycotypha africana]|uniref:uncharacterized protein n=1 Tax=Mycotypha africana TaxID=64632 RepID=UPI002300C6B2|nr:uncharacterized protein BDF20DRAFT_906652 [Mycotypha africana]KAI8975209.1 hypothetical protein BDF20DRAFT_906652 [Mycotypha africana]